METDLVTFETETYLNILKKYKQEYANKYGITRLGIFGSVARGEQTDNSDVDICVEIKKPDMFILIAIKDDLQNIFNRKVDIVRIRKNMNPYLLNTITKTAIYV
ncbi:nucleotidyltransferase family protein [Bacteroidales bacterium OttesenSCG-928-K03]|nr:nucleotidyltransferase family protein [Bacteroidales bacterium OttesenSCG-928-K03]